MNSAIVLCFLLGCVVIGQAFYVNRPVFPIKQKFCFDYRGRRVSPGQNYYDGCNSCICGSYGQPSVCTMRYCGPIPGKPVYPVKPVKPVYPVKY